MLNRLRRMSVIYLMTLIFAVTAFAKFDDDVNQQLFKSAAASALHNILEAESLQTSWTAWTAMNDGRSNGVDIRWKRGGFKFEGGNYEVFWQLRNRYRKSATLSYKLTFRKADGSTFTTSEVTKLDAGEINDSIGLHDIAYSLASYQVKEIEFTDD
jgi:hypothetical protein